MENEKRGISQITGKTEIKLGEKAFYKVTRIHRKEDHDKVRNALWKIYVNEKGNWRELKSAPSVPPKKGDEVSYTITNQALAGKELLVEAYIYEPEKKAPPGLKIKVVAGIEKKIQRVELFMSDDTPIKEDTILKYNQTIKVKVYTQNMPNELLKLTLYEDDADKSGHNPKNEKNKVAYKEKQTNKNGFLWHEFKLNAEFSKIANAMMDGSHDKLHEYYVLVESAKYGRKTSKNVEVENPDYVVHQTYENGKVTDHKNDKIYEGGVIEEVIIKGKYKKQIGIDPIPKTGRSVSIVSEPPEKKEEKVCDCKKYDLVWGDNIGCNERKKVIEVAKNLGVDPNWLMTVMALETAETFSPSIDNGIGYVGLIQFGKDAAETIGTTTDSLKKMNFVQQMDYVQKHLSQKRFQGKFKTLTDLYLAVLYPTASGHGSERDYVVLHGAAYRNNPLFFKEKGEWEWAYKTNKRGKQIKYKKPTNPDGDTFVWEVAMVAQEVYTKGLGVKENNFSCNESNDNIATDSSDADIEYHIFNNGGEIQYKIHNAKRQNAEYYYHDVNGNIHNIGKYKLNKIADNYGGTYKDRIGGSNIYLIDIRTVKNYSKDDVKFKLSINTNRYYINDVTFAALLGAMLDCNYTDFTFNGFSNEKGQSIGGSKSHKNGMHGDLRYLRKDKSGKSVHLDLNSETGDPCGWKGMDEARQNKFNDALYKYGWKSMLSWKYNNKTLHHAKHFENHNHHLHVQSFTPNLKEIKDEK